MTVQQQQPPADPSVTANPPTVAEPAPPVPSAPVAPQAQVAREQKRTSPMSKQHRRVSEETVLSRARRMMRSEMNKVAQALGMEKYDPTAFNAKIEEMKKAKESGMSLNDRYEQQINELKTANADLNGKLQAATQELGSAKKQIQTSSATMERMKAEYEVRSLASRAGINDLDYATHLLRQHLKGLPPDQQQALNEDGIKGFFEGLKKDPSKRYLFQEEKVAAGPQSIADEKAAKPPTTQPPAQQPGQSNLPAQGAPAPAGATPEAKDKNALDMGKRDFNAYAREKYHYTPGMA